MDVKLLPAKLGGTVRAIPSKSQAHRALLSAALADRPTWITCEAESKDIAATAACLTALGARIDRQPGGYAVTPLRLGREASAAVLPCEESGSTFRFLLPVVGALGREAIFEPKGRLSQRPLSPLYGELVRHGCTLSPQGSVPFLARGQLIPGRYRMDGGVSSQFISGLLFALPLLDGNSELRLTGQIESFPYISLTLAMLETFGIKIALDGTAFSIAGRQAYRSPGMLTVEGDWSNAAFWLGAGATGSGPVTCTGLDLGSRQGDRAIAELLQRFGAQVTEKDSAVTVSGGALRGIEIDARDIPDLVPILAVVAAAAEGTTVIRGAERLRMKESDRLASVTDMLRRLGAEASETQDGLLIRGGAALTGGRASSWGDHRIAMAAAVASLVCAGPVTIQGAEAVEKSYPGFFDDFRALGGSAETIQ